MRHDIVTSGRVKDGQTHRRLSWVARGAAVLVALASLSGTALAETGVKGSPQPELKPFVIGHSDGPSYTTTDGFNSTMIVVYEVATPNTDGAIDVCVLKRGATSCESTSTLTPESGASVMDNPSVTVEPGNHVYVAMDDCCTAPDLLFESTDGGDTFGGPVQLGPSNAPNINVSESFGVTGFGVHMIWAEGDAGASFPVEFAPLPDPLVPATDQVVTAMTDPAEFNTAGLGSYNGGVIAAGSDFNNVTMASFAPAGSMAFNTVGSFAGEDLIAASGPALVTQQANGGESLVLRLFNGTSFGPPSVVPVSGGGGPNWNAAEWAGGRTYIFTERNQDSYDLEMQSTTSGSSWTPRTDLGNATSSNAFSVALDDTGSGLVVGTGSSGPVTAYPVLAPQAVSFTLSNHRARAGASVEATGASGSPAAGGTVQLERLEHGLWYVVSTTHEVSGGRFHFRISESAAGPYTFRAVVADVPGYVQYGYSSSSTLTVS